MSTRTARTTSVAIDTGTDHCHLAIAKQLGLKVRFGPGTTGGAPVDFGR
jgi:hypothetical protein